MKNPRHCLLPLFFAALACGSKHNNTKSTSAALSADDFVADSSVTPLDLATFQAKLGGILDNFETAYGPAATSTASSTETSASSTSALQVCSTQVAKKDLITTQGDQYTWNGDFDLSSCFSSSNTTTAQVTVSSANMQITDAETCTGQDYSAENGETSGQGASKLHCPGTSGQSATHFENLTVAFDVTYTLGSITAKSVSTSLSADMTADSAPCTAHFGDGGKISYDECLHLEHTNTSSTTNGLSSFGSTDTSSGASLDSLPGLPSRGGSASGGSSTTNSEDVVRLDGTGLTGNLNTAYYDGGQFAVTINNWTGTITFTDGDKLPTATFTSSTGQTTTVDLSALNADGTLEPTEPTEPVDPTPSPTPLPTETPTPSPSPTPTPSSGPICGMPGTLPAQPAGRSAPAGATTAVLDSAHMSNGLTLASGGLLVTGTNPGLIANGVRANLGKTAGKWYFEVSVIQTSCQPYFGIGVVQDNEPIDSAGKDLGACGVNVDGNVYCAGVRNGSVASPFGSATVIGVAVDLDNHILYFSENGVWANGMTPGGGGGQSWVPTSSINTYPLVGLNSGDSLQVNFGAQQFYGQVPQGYNPGWY